MVVEILRLDKPWQAVTELWKLHYKLLFLSREFIVMNDLAPMLCPNGPRELESGRMLAKLGEMVG